MTDGVERLVRCFGAVFPHCPRGEVEGATAETVLGWDSLATVTLVALLEEEFGIQIDILDLTEFQSFKSMRNYFHERGCLD